MDPLHPEIKPEHSEPIVPVERLTKPERAGRGALFIPAGLFLGLGIGYAEGDIISGLCIGIGIGFALAAVSLFARK